MCACVRACVRVCERERETEDTVYTASLDSGAGGNGRDREDSKNNHTIAQEHHQHGLVEPCLRGATQRKHVM